MRALNNLIIIIIALSLSGFTNPGKDEFAGDYNLFRIDRNRDADVVMYDVKLDRQGNLHKSHPVNIYWKRLSQNGELEPITNIQKNFGYGIRYFENSIEMADFKLVSYKDQVFQIRRSNEGQFRVYTRTAGCELEVNNLYIQFKDNAFWLPEILKIEIQGLDTENGNPVTAVITPESGNSTLKIAKR